MDEYFINEFYLPIDYVSDVYPLEKDVVEDLEINDKKTSPYHYFTQVNYEPTEEPHSIHELLFHKMYSKYTTNIHYLKDIQKLIKEYEIQPDVKTDYFDRWKENISDNGLLEKHQYITWNHLKMLNSSPKFLQTMTLYNLSSPMISIMMPFLFLIFPFFIIRFIMKLPITFENYKNTLVQQFKHHAVGKMFDLFSSDISSNKKFYILFTIGFYFLSLYQNILSCIKFYSSIHTIQNFLYSTKEHLLQTLSYMKSLLHHCEGKKTLSGYMTYLREKKKDLEELYQQVSLVYSPSFKLSKLFDVGTYMSLFYRLTQEEEYREKIMFSFGIHSFISHLNGIKTNLSNNVLSLCRYKNKTTLKQQYYPSLSLDKPVKNNLIVTNTIITGPNASGKTTLLKSSLLNILFSQQFGCGFYERKTTISPYHYLHSYINIPDTSGRDSLFQAEARRCLRIIHSIQREPKKKHFIIFDELYSGTNPNEAIDIARSFLSYIRSFKVTYILTTHFIELTQMKEIKNKQMEVHVDEQTQDISYSYRVNSGISRIKGGYHVICDLGYPKEILEYIK